MRIALLLLVLCGHARAADPDTEVAQRLFDEGAAAYAAGDYPRAIERMEAARRVAPMPAFDFNVARCRDRMGDEKAALASYQRFVAAAPSAPEAAEARERIATLEARLRADAVLRRRRALGPALLAAASIAVLATGAGLLGSVPSAYDGVQARWLSQGATSSVTSDASALRGREIAGGVVLGIGLALATADVAWWVVMARRPTVRF